jgi:hypothetical protein
MDEETIHCLIAAEIDFESWSDRVKRRPKAKKNVSQSTQKPLGVRYAEVLKLRQAILQTQSATKPLKIDQPTSE